MSNGKKKSLDEIFYNDIRYYYVSGGLFSSLSACRENVGTAQFKAQTDIYFIERWQHGYGDIII